MKETQITDKLEQPQDLNAVHDKLRVGDLMFCSGTGIVSDAIKEATGSMFSHVGILIDFQATNQWLVAESVEHIGVRCVTLREGYLENYCGSGKPYPGQVMIARHADMPEKQEALKRLQETALQLLGDKYAEGDIFKIATRIALKKIGINENGLVHEGHKYICSEYVYYCLLACGINLPYDKRGFISPANIASLDKVTLIANLKPKAVLPEPEFTYS